MTLSIIIPYYNAERYTRELLECLNRQMDPDVEVILIDDGSDRAFSADYEWLTIKRKKNGGASSARNAGLDMASGEYVAFIDADDMVAENYIPMILGKIEAEHFDYCYLSWRTMPGRWNCHVRLKSIDDKFPPFNLCVWNRIYRMDMIGSVRFNTKKAIAEDAEFIRKVKEKGRKKAFIRDYMYFYRGEAPDSLTKKFSRGALDMERIVYHYQHVTADMTHLIKEFEEADEYAEVILMTNQNDIEELEEHAMVLNPPQLIKGTELRGEPTDLFVQIEIPEETQIVLWTAETFDIGGIETFNYNFCQQMHKLYDIILLYEKIDPMQLARLSEIVDCRKIDLSKTIKCDTVIVNRITDTVPANIIYKQKVQMVHACKMIQTWTIPEADKTVAVSKVAAGTFPELAEFSVINNMTWPEERDKALLLVSATRTKTFEKGQKRMADLAQLMDRRGVPYIWLCFTDGPIKGATKHMIRMDTTLDITPYIKAADYLVQLSDMEGFCYSIVEALEAGTPVITTPIDVLPEIGFEDMINGYVVPFEITDAIDTDLFVKRQLKGRFEYAYDNEKRVKQWRKILGTKKPKRKYDPNKSVKVRIVKKYFDIVFNREMQSGEVVSMTGPRAKTIIGAGFGIEMKGAKG